MLVIFNLASGKLHLFKNKFLTEKTVLYISTEILTKTGHTF